MSQHYSILPTLLNWYVERVTLSWVQCSSLHRSWNWYVVVVLEHGWKTAVVSSGPSMPSSRRRDRLPEPSLESELASSSPSIGSCHRLHQSACVPPFSPRIGISLRYGLPPPVEPGRLPFRNRSNSLSKGNLGRVRSRFDWTLQETPTCDRWTNRSDPIARQATCTCVASVGSNEASEGGRRGGVEDVEETRATERRHDVDGGVTWSTRGTGKLGPCPSDVGRHRTDTHPEDHLQTKAKKERIASIRRVPGKQKSILVVSGTLQLRSSKER